jgi:hypothetical protein
LKPVTGGFELRYKADDLRNGTTGVIVGMTREPRFLPSTFAAADARPLDDAVRGAAIEMADRLIEGTLVNGGHVRLQQNGETTRFGEYVLRLFMDDLAQQLPIAARRHAGAQAVTGAAPAPAPEAPVTIGLTVYDQEHWVEVRFADESPDGGSNTSVRTRITMDSIASANLLPVKPQCGNFVHRVSGEALVGKQLDHEGALRAARALARARAIAEETCASVAGAPAVVRDTADAGWALQAITGGVTFDESWSEKANLDDGKRVRTDLTTKVRILGGASAPALKVALSPPVVQSETPFGITISTETAAYVAVFDWQSDDRVLRLYPFGVDHALAVAAGQPLILPRRGEVPFMSEPRPGLNTDFEALIVVASAKPLDYDGLAEEVAATAEESLQRAKPVGELFEALAKIQTPLTLAVVPYQIIPKT